jgi:hypothetical protein
MRRIVKKTGAKALVFLFVFFMLSALFSQFALAENSPPILTKGTVTPRKSYPNIDYLFTVTYTDADNDTPSSVTVFIDGVEYEMKGVDPADENYTDGKDYSFKKIMSEGSYSVYYSADDGNNNVVTSDSFTLSVTWDVGHYDIIHFIEEEIFPGIILVLSFLFIVALLLCIISILMVLQMRKIAKGLEKGEGKGEDTGEHPNNEIQEESQTQ